MSRIDLEARLEDAGLKALDDALRQSAYDALPPQRRAWLKTTLALVEAVHGQRGASWSGQSRPELGFSHTLHKSPAQWTLCILGAGFAAAPRLAAALMTARLAGQENTLVAWEGKPEDPTLLTVLDLTGIERAYASSKPDWNAVETTLRESCGPDGRIMLFDTRGTFALPCWSDCPPALAADATVDREIIQWAHPDAIWTSADARPTAFYGIAPTEAALHLKPGLEGTWLCPGLEPDFFMSLRRKILFDKSR